MSRYYFETEQVHPSVADVLPETADYELFEATSAALEAGSLVRLFRMKAGLSQAALAEKVQVSQARISQIENADGRDGPTYALLRRLAFACDINLTELLISALVPDQ